METTSDSSDTCIEIQPPVCRICLESEPVNQLFNPCACDGSIAWIHRSCLIKWFKITSKNENKVRCELCQTPYQYSNSLQNKFKTDIVQLRKLLRVWNMCTLLLGLIAVQSCTLIAFAFVILCLQSQHQAMVDAMVYISPLRPWDYGTYGYIYAYIANISSTIYTISSISLLFAWPNNVSQRTYMHMLMDTYPSLILLGCNGTVHIILYLCGGIYIQVLVAHSLLHIICMIKRQIYQSLIRRIKKKHAQVIEYIIGLPWLESK